MSPLPSRVSKHGFKKGPQRTSVKSLKKAPHGRPRWFRVTLQPRFLNRKKKEGLKERPDDWSWSLRQK